MDILGLISIPNWLLILVAFVAIVFTYLTWLHSIFEKIGVPGPKPGILGIFGEYRKNGVSKTDIDLVRKYGKRVGIFHGREPVLLIADPEMVKQICVKEFSNFTNRKNIFPLNKTFRSAVSVAEDDHWKFIRSVLSPTFSSGKMRQIVALIQRAQKNMVDNVQRRMKEKKSVEMRHLFQCFTMDVIASTEFGIDVNSQKNPDDPFVKHAKKSMSTRFGIFVSFCFLFPFVKHIFEFFDFGTAPKDSLEFFTKVVKKAVAERSEDDAVKRRDLLQLMLNAHKESADADDVDPDTKLDFEAFKKRGLTTDELLANAIIFILAAYETTSLTLTFATYLLATNPECQEKLAKEIEKNIGSAPPTYDNIWNLPYLDNVLNETLRMYTPAVRTARVGTEDVEICGTKIPKGMEIQFAIYAMHYDPEYWPEPDKFDPDRFLPENSEGRHPYCYLPFGQGPRNCVGMRLAQLETKMTLVTLLQNFRITTAPETEIPIKVENSSFFTRPAGDVFLRLEAK